MLRWLRSFRRKLSEPLISKHTKSKRRSSHTLVRSRTSHVENNGNLSSEVPSLRHNGQCVRVMHPPVPDSLALVVSLAVYARSPLRSDPPPQSSPPTSTPTSSPLEPQGHSNTPPKRCMQCQATSPSPLLGLCRISLTSLLRVTPKSGFATQPPPHLLPSIPQPSTSTPAPSAPNPVGVDVLIPEYPKIHRALPDPTIGGLQSTPNSVRVDAPTSPNPWVCPSALNPASVPPAAAQNPTGLNVAMPRQRQAMRNQPQHLGWFKSPK